MSDERTPEGIEYTSAEGAVISYPGCFVCGENNTQGLALKFTWDGLVCRTEFTASEQFAGYRRVLHGGIIASILDEVMIKAILAQGIIAVTGELTIKYRSPARSGDLLSFTGEVTEQSARLIRTVGRALNDAGDLIAEAHAKYVVVRDRVFLGELTKSLVGGKE
ncbi:MAG TPA: PaaI family thioesterase [candidate division Zixibacteria bacterium]|nr:PaaI family thioesterase [candidate division Zixibacteria bacterium]